MKLLIREARITDPGSSHNRKVRDILIEGGKITAIDEKGKLKAEKGVRVFEADNLHVSPGWFDMRARFRDPGFEYKEDLLTGCRAAAAGGFTGVAVMPSTAPPIDTKSGVEYIRNKTQGNVVDVFPVGALSQKMEGKDISEMFDMHNSGAVAFSDDKQPVLDAGLMIRAMLYVKNFGSLIISWPDDKTISAGGKMNEGAVSTELGLKGIPSIAEEVMIMRDMLLAEYAGSKIHFGPISSARSVKLIREAKNKGLEVSAEVTAHHLLVDETALAGFDSHYKVKPPFRTAKDLNALRKGLADGTIDVICSDHTPENEEMKKMEFDDAAFGIIALETAFAAANTALRDILSPADLIGKIAINPRKILGIPVPSVNEGLNANLTLFNPDLKWTFRKEHIRSKSFNTPFIGTSFTGKALGVVNNNQFSGEER